MPSAARSSPLIKEITVAARMGGGDPDMNPRLRLAIDKAKAENMPKDNIERAIKRGSGDLEGVDYEEIRYEGYGIGGAAVMVDCLTDNRTRTVADVRHAFTKHGGNLGTDGSVAFLFKHCGQLLFAPGTDEDKLMEAALDAGAEDVVTNDDGCIEVICEPGSFAAVKAGLEKAGLKPELAEVTMKADDRDRAGRRGRRAHAEAARRAGRPRRRAGRLHHRGRRRVKTASTSTRNRRPRVSRQANRAPMRILGIDPGLRVTGFGIVDKTGQRLTYVTSGCVKTGEGVDLPARLKTILDGLCGSSRTTCPQEVAVEKVFVNVNPQSTLLLGQARGAAICAAVSRALPVAEYTALQVKQAVVGNGHAHKEQVQEMVRRLLKLPGQPERRRRRRARLRDLSCAWRTRAGRAVDGGLSGASRPAGGMKARA